MAKTSHVSHYQHVNACWACDLSFVKEVCACTAGLHVVFFELEPGQRIILMKVDTNQTGEQGVDLDAEAYQTSKRLLKLTCQHQSNPVTPSDCIMSLIGESALLHPYINLDPIPGTSHSHLNDVHISDAALSLSCVSTAR